MKGEHNLGDFIISTKKLRADMERAKSKATDKAREKKGLKEKQEDCKGK
jgi:hypothetical protein